MKAGDAKSANCSKRVQLGRSSAKQPMGWKPFRKCGNRRPDVVLLDLSLPTLGGIDVTRRIRELSLDCKIVILSLDTSLDVIEAAMLAGAQGYVCKTDAPHDLVPAIETVLRDERFFGSSLTGYKSTGCHGEVGPHRHEVMFYSYDTMLLCTAGRFIAAALKADSAAIVIARKNYQESLRQRVKTEGVDTDAALQHGTYISLDAADMLSTVMVNGWPDPGRFFGALGGCMEAAAKAAKAARPRVVIFGEAVALLQAQGKGDAAIRIEQFCDDLAKTRPVDILCAYPLSGFHGTEGNQVFQRICAEHSAAYSK